MFVHTPSIKEIEDVFHTRALLEGECARLAAGKIADTQLRVLERILGLGASAVEAGETPELLKLNERFHSTIVAAAENSVMSKMMETLQRRIRWYFSGVVVTRAVGSWDQHSKIYLALRDRDGGTAAGHMADHIDQTLRALQARWVPANGVALMPGG